MKNQFYMILPSNSSMEIFPDNTTSCYTTKLPQEINLRGTWEVGIAEIHFPRSFLHLRKEDREITVYNTVYAVDKAQYKNSIKRSTYNVLHIPYGIYDGIKEFLDRINKTLKNTHVGFKLSTEDNNNTFVYGERTCNSKECNFVHFLKMSRAILDILGYSDVKDHLNIDINRAIASRAADILNALPKQLFIYSDISEPCIVGDVQTSLLRIVPINYNSYVFSSNQHQTFAPVHYVPLIRNCFRTITIDIRNDLGQFIPFECGTSTVTLHFRQVN